jgi:uncharacterized protein YjbJ (UPF0337 family)
LENITFMKPSTKNRAKGSARQVKGKAKAAIGRLTRNQRLETEGKVQSAVGRIQRKVGEAQKDYEKDEGY